MGELLRGLIFVVLAFALGEILDSIRDVLLEDAWNNRAKVRVNWDFFFEAREDQIEKLRTSYFTYYVFNHNLALGLLLLSGAELVADHPALVALCLTAACVLALDARSLRREIAKHTTNRTV